MELDRLYSVSEAAKVLGGISKWTIHAWLSQGRLQRTKVGGRTGLIPVLSSLPAASGALSSSSGRRAQ
jgi:excisionase family DNA binding protein